VGEPTGGGEGEAERPPAESLVNLTEHDVVPDGDRLVVPDLRLGAGSVSGDRL
jgi:hypothetical protein